MKSFDEKRLEFYANNSPLPVIEWDAEFIVSVWTGDAERIFGWKAEEVVGKKIMEFNFIYEPDIPIVEETMKKLITEKSNYLVSSNRNYRKDGDMIYCRWYNTILHDRNGKTQFILSQVIDITERVKYEQELLQLNKDKDRFLSILSHDLRSPFGALHNLSMLLKENIRRYDIEEIEVQVNTINESIQNTYNLLEDLLGWVRIQQNRMPYKPQKLVLSDVFNNVIGAFTQSANIKNIKILEFTAERIEVVADENMLKAILRNLVSNALKFTDINGVIIISAIQVEAEVKIAVSDNGIGIKPDDISKLFDMSNFFTTKGISGEEGTGLGLILCKEFVGKHSGEIWVESEFGKGSAFYFTIPDISRSKS